MNIFTKLGSRKFWVAILVIGTGMVTISQGFLNGSDVATIAGAIVTAAGAIYIPSEAKVDTARVGNESTETVSTDENSETVSTVDANE